MSQGTKNRPTSLDITKELDGVGADFNAFTAKDHTGYYVRVNHEELELALDVVSDMLFNSLFSSAELEKERGVIIEEINMYEDNPLLMINNVFDETVFKGNPLAKLVSGIKENIRSMSRAQIVRYFQANYLTDKVIVAIGGKFPQERIKKLISSSFNISSPPKLVHSSFKKFVVHQTRPRVNLRTKETEQVHLALGYPAYKMTDPRIYPLSLLAVILGGNMSSRLFLEIREKLGLAYYIRIMVDVYQDTGTFTVYAGLDKKKIDLAIKTILGELKKATNSPVMSEELHRAKEFIKGKLILTLEDSAQRVQWLCTQQLLKGHIETLEEQIKKIEKVTTLEIQKVAKEIIKNSRINLGIIGPYQRKEKFLRLLTY